LVQLSAAERSQASHAKLANHWMENLRPTELLLSQVRHAMPAAFLFAAISSCYL
jgi:hypothetical protein